MLTADLVRPRLRKRGEFLHIRMIDHSFTQTAQELIDLFQQHVDQPRRVWSEALEEYEGVRLDYIIVRGLAKVLTDAATFTPLETVEAPETVRERLFAAGPVFDKVDLFHPRNRADTVAEIAQSFTTDVNSLETALFADLPAEHILTDVGTDWTPEALIARYNLELARAALYWCDEMTVEIYDTFKDFWRYLKLFKLMFWATPHENGYRVELDGPISPFVKSTTRYGRQFAGFLPALLLCDQWQLSASVQPPNQDEKLHYVLNDSTDLTSHFRRSGEFDSKMEADFAAEFHDKFGDERAKWQLTREDEVILLGDTVMIPDFTLTHADGRRVVIEIVGFWHPEYLRRKIAKVQAAKRDDLLLLVYEGVNLTAQQLEDVPAEVLYFKNKPVLKDVMATVERMAR